MRFWVFVILLTAACGDDKTDGDTRATDTTTGIDSAVPDIRDSHDSVDEDTAPPPDIDAPDTVDTTPTETGPDTPDSADTTPEVDDTHEVGDTSDGETADVPSGPELAGGCALAVRFGGFQAVDDGEYGYVDGEVADAVLPVSVLELVRTDGDCRLYKKTNPFCDPPCSPSQTCDYDGRCLPYPAPQDLGTVTVTGMAGGPVVMTPVQPGNLYYATEIPYPPWTPGAELTLTTAGGAFSAVTLSGVAPDPVEPAATTWTLTAGEPVVVAWDAPAGPTATRVEVSVLIDQHGNAPASLRCDFEDDGEGTVSAAILDALRAAGVSGFPSGKLVRQTLDSQALSSGDEAGCMDFAARSPRSIKIVVSGHIPCKKDMDCPPGKTCDEPIETCIAN